MLPRTRRTKFFAKRPLLRLVADDAVSSSVLNCVGCVGCVGWKSCVGRGSWDVGIFAWVVGKFTWVVGPFYR